MAEKSTVLKWTEDRVKVLVETYDKANPATVDAAAEALSVSKRAVISKLVNLKLYVTPEKVVKAKKDDGPSKKEILARIDAEGSRIGMAKFSEGFDAATKPALTRLADTLARIPEAE